MGSEMCIRDRGMLEPFWSDPGDVGAARAPRTLALSCCLSSRILSVGLGLITDRGLWSLLLPRTDFRGSWSAKTDLRSMVFGFPARARIRGSDLRIAIPCLGDSIRLGSRVAGAVLADPGDVGAARASRTFALPCCLRSVGLAPILDLGPWSLGPGIGSTDRDPLLG